MSKLRLLGSRLVVAPFKPTMTDSGILFDMGRQDDRKRWSVLQVGPKVQNIVPGDKVLTHGNEEPLFDWPGDNVRVIDASHVLAVWK
jgi:co-chaperonin GroES (HSP10)